MFVEAFSNSVSDEQLRFIESVAVGVIICPKLSFKILGHGKIIVYFVQKLTYHLNVITEFIQVYVWRIPRERGITAAGPSFLDHWIPTTFGCRIDSMDIEDQLLDPVKFCSGDIRNLLANIRFCLSPKVLQIMSARWGLWPFIEITPVSHRFLERQFNVLSIQEEDWKDDCIDLIS